MALAGHVANKNVQPSTFPLWSGEAERHHLYNSACDMTILVGYDYWMVIVGCKNARLILDKAGVFFIALEMGNDRKVDDGRKGIVRVQTSVSTARGLFASRRECTFCSK